MGEGAPGRPGVTEEEDTRRVSRIRQRALELDGQPFLLAAARRLRRQLPGDASFGDPLSTAGDHPASVVGRQFLRQLGGYVFHFSLIRADDRV